MNIQPNTLIHGDALNVLRQIPPNTADAVITDPPYSSTMRHESGRAPRTRSKYLSTGKIAAAYAEHNFPGDTLDQRSWCNWSAEWLSLAREATKPGGVAAVFTDWRKLAALTDAVQWAGWIWRGIMVWDKKNSRPTRGRPRQQCEFIVWASNGSMDINRIAPVMPGVFCVPSPTGEKRLHQTEKPLALMQNLVHMCEKGGTVLDPFMGSGSTVAAAALEGYAYIGIEKDPYYFSVSQKRMQDIASARQSDEQEEDEG